MTVISFDYPQYPDKPDWTAAEKAHAEAIAKAQMDKAGLVEKARTETPGHVDILCEVPLPVVDITP